ncbi:hypothetical protein GJV26_28515 [Massilia dura]|uniref:Uncharacterized protein n=1 Tax=Pseudoduganella dura TaxID=321982 RepID=A0A6I3XP53_9BURK|nr:hypothetical protein [Pseudoduganella dura]MUI16370.1 hypothetical protein [Pseudoduganella dura]GGX86297.1 hypothetical protein GCM10007386_16380 [Pseudoduganella dura]
MTRTRFVPHGLRHSGGQALTEFIVIALVLVPLFLLIPLIGKYQSISHATAMASRYVAFDAMANNAGMSAFKPRAQLEQEVRRRFYSNSDAPIKTNDEAGDFKANQNLMWVDPQGNALISKFSDVSVSFGAANKTNHADGITGADDDKPFNMPVPFKTANQLDLKSGIYRANVHVKLANLQDIGPGFASTYEGFKNINLTVSRHSAVLPDSWTATGPVQVENRIDQPVLFPGRILKDAKIATDAAVSIVELPGIKKPHLGELEFWRDELPADRKQ